MEPFLPIVALSLAVSLSSATLASALGIPLAALLALVRFPGRGVLVVAVNALLGLPPVVVGLEGLPLEAAAAFIVGFLRRDYAAAGLFDHFKPFMDAGTMTWDMEVQVTVALVTVTLFIPCIANFFMILKERGWRTGVGIAGFILPFSVAVGAGVNQLMRFFR